MLMTIIRKKISIFDWSLQLYFSRKRQGVLDEKKSTNTSSSFNSIIYILSHATKMQLFWSQLKVNDVLPHVPIFNYLKYKCYYSFEII